MHVIFSFQFSLHQYLTCADLEQHYSILTKSQIKRYCDMRPLNAILNCITSMTVIEWYSGHPVKTSHPCNYILHSNPTPATEYSTTRTKVEYLDILKVYKKVCLLIYIYTCFVQYMHILHMYVHVCTVHITLQCITVHITVYHWT